MPEETTEFASGVVSSKVPRIDYISFSSLERLAKRCEAGVERKGSKAINASTTNLAPYTDKDFIVERCVHAIKHAFTLIQKVRGLAPDDGEDDAGAIMWAGSFLCDATDALARKEASNGAILKAVAESPVLDEIDAIIFKGRGSRGLRKSVRKQVTRKR